MAANFQAQAALDFISVRQLATSKEIAKIVLFLAIDNAQFVGGVRVVADGGKTVT